MNTSASAETSNRAPKIFLWLSGLAILGAGIGVGGFQFAVELFWYLPLLCGWIALRFGVRALLPLTPVAVLPVISFNGPFWVNAGISFPALLVTLGFVLSCGNRDMPGTMQGLLRFKSTWTAGLILCGCAFATVERGVVHIAGYNPLYIDVLAIPAMALIVASIRWSSVMQTLGLGAFKQQPWLTVIPVAIAGTAMLSVGLQFRVIDSPWSVRFGVANIGAILPLLCFFAVTWRIAGLLPVLTALIAAAAIEYCLFHSVGPLAATLLPGHYRLDLNWTSLALSAIAAVLGLQFAPFWSDGRFGAQERTRRTIVLLVLLLALTLVTPIVTQQPLGIYSTTCWIIAGISFIAAADWKDGGLFAAPLLILFMCLQSYLLFSPETSPGSVAESLMRAGVVSFPFAFCGALTSVARIANSHRHAATIEKGPESIVNISDQSQVVEKIDRAATWRSFFAVAAPFIAVWTFFHLYEDIIAFLQDAPFQSVEPAFIALFLVAGPVLALSPLGFILWDWIDRQTWLRPIAAISGSALGAVVLMMVGGAIGAGALIFKEEFGQELPLYAKGLTPYLVSLSIVAGLWTLSSVRKIRVLAQLGTLVLLSISAYAFYDLATITGNDSAGSLMQAAGSLLLTGFFAVGTMRFIRMRLVLAQDTPREMLFGELRDKSFWIRLAAIAGLPSSLWRTSAFKTPPLWAFLTARPILYAGFAFLKSYWYLGAVLMAAAHGIFHFGKKSAASAIWQPEGTDETEAPILFLRGFSDDQFNFKRPKWNLYARWLDLWAFRRNVDEAMIDEVAQFGPVVALGRPRDSEAPFGAQRYYAKNEEWKSIIANCARRAKAIVLVASNSPGVKWEYDFLKQEGLLGKVLLLFHPTPDRDDSNAHALEWFTSSETSDRLQEGVIGGRIVCISISGDDFRVLTCDTPTPGAYVLALREYFHRLPPISH